jgi:hypothetical protein
MWRATHLSRLGDRKARQGDTIFSRQENGEGTKKKNEKVKEEGQETQKAQPSR